MPGIGIKLSVYDYCCSTNTFVVVVVLTLTHNSMQSVVAGQAPITLEWKKYLGSKTEAKRKTSIRTPPLRTPGKQKGDY